MPLKKNKAKSAQGAAPFFIWPHENVTKRIQPPPPSTSTISEEKGSSWFSKNQGIDYI